MEHIVSFSGTSHRGVPGHDPLSRDADPSDPAGVPRD